MSNRPKAKQGDVDGDTVVAVAGMMQRTGATGFQMRYSDDERPVVWIAVAEYAGGVADCAAGMTPGAAAWRLAEQLLDGGECKLCGKATAVVRQAGELPELPGVCQWRLLGDRIVSGCAAT